MGFKREDGRRRRITHLNSIVSWGVCREVSLRGYQGK